MSSPDDQAAALRAALDAAIDELGDDSEEDDDEEDDDHYHDEDEDAADLSSVPSQVAASGHQQHSSQGPGTPKVSSPNRSATVVAPPSANPDVETSVAVHPSSDKQAAPATPQPPSAPTFLGPPRPPTTTDSHTKKKPPTNPDTLFMEMMEDMLLNPQEGISDPDEMMMRLVEKMQEQLHDMEEREKEEEQMDENNDVLVADIPEQTHETESETTIASVPVPVPPDVPTSAPTPARDGGTAVEHTTTHSPATTVSSASKDASKSSKKSKSTTKVRKPPTSPTDTEQGVDKAINSLIEDLAKQASLDPNEGLDNVNENELLNLLMKGMGNPGSGEGDFDADAMIDGMMEQLLCKDLMYEPMKQVAIRFPKWLEERRNVLSEKELKERQRQCQCFQKLVHAYETQPNDTQHLMELMQEVQEFGQPPREIIQEIAPGLELDANGLPKLEGSGLPFGTNEECRVM